MELVCRFKEGTDSVEPPNLTSEFSETVFSLKEEMHRLMFLVLCAAFCAHFTALPLRPSLRDCVIAVKRRVGAGARD